jgi:hypothetical protein
MAQSEEEKKERRHLWYLKNRERKIKYATEYASQHQDEVKQYKKTYREEHKTEIREKERGRYVENRQDPAYVEKSQAHSNDWKRRNRPKVQEYERTKYASDVEWKLSKNLRNRLGAFVRGERKSAKLREYLGCTLPELRAYLESQFQPGMTWDNHGEWHIDHKKPLSSFDLTKRIQLMAACHYTNLQPLWAKINLSKSGPRRKKR